MCASSQDVYISLQVNIYRLWIMWIPQWDSTNNVWIKKGLNIISPDLCSHINCATSVEYTHKHVSVFHPPKDDDQMFWSPHSSWTDAIMISIVKRTPGRRTLHSEKEVSWSLYYLFALELYSRRKRHECTHDVGCRYKLSFKRKFQSTGRGDYSVSWHDFTLFFPTWALLGAEQTRRPGWGVSRCLCAARTNSHFVKENSKFWQLTWLSDQNLCKPWGIAGKPIPCSIWVTQPFLHQAVVGTRIAAFCPVQRQHVESGRQPLGLYPPSESLLVCVGAVLKSPRAFDSQQQLIGFWPRRPPHIPEHSMLGVLVGLGGYRAIDPDTAVL